MPVRPPWPRAAPRAGPPWFDDHDAARLAAAPGHVLLRSEHYDDARDVLTDALNRLPPSARHARVLCLVDHVATGLGCGDLDEARRNCRPSGRNLFTALCTRPVQPGSARSVLPSMAQNAPPRFAHSTSTSPASPPPDPHTAGDMDRS